MTETSSAVESQEFDPIHRPRHYADHPSGVQPIEVIEHMRCCNLGNAFRYLCRYKLKNDPQQDLEKCKFYLVREQIRVFEVYNGDYPELILGTQALATAYSKLCRYIAGEPDAYVASILRKIWDIDTGLCPPEDLRIVISRVSSLIREEN